MLVASNFAADVGGFQVLGREFVVCCSSGVLWMEIFVTRKVQLVGIYITTALKVYYWKMIPALSIHCFETLSHFSAHKIIVNSFKVFNNLGSLCLKNSNYNKIIANQSFFRTYSSATAGTTSCTRRWKSASTQRLLLTRLLPSLLQKTYLFIM